LRTRVKSQEFWRKSIGLGIEGVGFRCKRLWLIAQGRGSGFRDEEVYGWGFTAFGFGVMFQAVGVRLTINPKP